MIGLDVVFTNAEKHYGCRMFYPPAGTRGVVKSVGDTDVYVRWEHDSTTGDDCWWCDLADIVSLEEYLVALGLRIDRF